MIAYTMVGTTDLNRSARFYEPIFSAMGLEISWRDERSVAWGVPGNRTPPFTLVFLITKRKHAPAMEP